MNKNTTTTNAPAATQADTILTTKAAANLASDSPDLCAYLSEDGKQQLLCTQTEAEGFCDAYGILLANIVYPEQFELLRQWLTPVNPDATREQIVSAVARAIEAKPECVSNLWVIDRIVAGAPVACNLFVFMPNAEWKQAAQNVLELTATQYHFERIEGTDGQLYRTFHQRPDGFSLSVEIEAKKLFATLTPEEVTYAADPARGEFRGFAALHDLCDANMILPGVDGGPDSLPANDEACLAFWNAVMDEVTRLILNPESEPVDYLESLLGESHTGTVPTTEQLRAAAWKLLDECYSGESRCYRQPSVEAVEALRDALTGRARA